MPLVVNDKSQTFCDVAEEGWRMMSEFDELPSWIREMLAESPFNICPVCFYNRWADLCAGAGDRETALQVLNEFEERIAATMDQAA